MLWVNSRIITFGTKKQETLRSVNAPRTCSKRGPKVRTNNTKRQNRIDLMEQTLVILKPSAVERCLIGEIITRIQDKGLIIGVSFFLSLYSGKHDCLPGDCDVP